jgi:hypothetical protein
MEKGEKLTIRLTEVLRRALQREADEAGIKLSEHIRWILLVTHPHLEAFEDLARIAASIQKAGVIGSDSMPYLLNMRRRLEEGLQAVQGLEPLAMQWRETAMQELRVTIADVNEHIRVLTELDEQTSPEHSLFSCICNKPDCVVGRYIAGRQRAPGART